MEDTEKRIETGIFGVDRILEGGFRDKTAIVVVGASGTGKSTFAMQFIMHGISRGEQGLYITMEEEPEQIMREGRLLGWDMQKYYEKELFFIHLKGRNFKKMILEQLPQLVAARSDYSVKTRVCIDPMTPVIWAVEDKQEQRELIAALFNTLKRLGVVMCTVEEHSKPGETIGEDVLLPIYLSDGAIHLEYHPIGGAFNRTLQILKMRGIAHGEEVYPYIFARGAGVIVRTSPEERTKEQKMSFDEVFEDAIRTAKSLKATEYVIKQLEYMRRHWTYEYSPEETLQIMFDSLGLKAEK